MTRSSAAFTSRLPLELCVLIVLSLRYFLLQIAAGEGVSGVIDVHGDLYTWGKNLNTGMLGHTIYGTGTRRPARVDSLHKVPLADVAFGSRHAAAVVGTKAGVPLS
jgi:Regulator of chromosome condensation (RCC1) repeat